MSYAVLCARVFMMTDEPMKLTWRAYDWVRETIPGAVVTNWAFRALLLTNHEVEASWLTRQGVKHAVMGTISCNRTWLFRACQDVFG